jgi:hypothetical protein
VAIAALCVLFGGGGGLRGKKRDWKGMYSVYIARLFTKNSIKNYLWQRDGFYMITDNCKIVPKCTIEV